ncbi:hypothetical protein GXW83_07935 [Streptacidiphilus sp. PB12-B1b]|uniref:hypothetical protein n=1 Tax=Streptacidiphilus sp. PB12-B1b TaxID=2705012 RepID=UPI0015FBBE49|nr:hypothetical protein [Streptacidiphilus sp. PB12-B1b]QMU75678.1 hypothetical protein GXW83_07935 [Streptacidiphilus sp. PB12-B1b]
MSGLTRLIALAANLAALILVAWIVLYLFDASTGNSVVHWFQQAADWLATWSRSLFDGVHNNKLHALLVFGIPALVYAAVGNGIHQTANRA